MTPEELEQLQFFSAEIAKILYNNTPPVSTDQSGKY
jgi:hypothetical protein